MKSQFAELYEKSIHPIQEGDVVKGKIVAIRNREAVVDIGYKSEGILAFEEFSDASEIQMDAEIDVLFEGFDDELRK